MDQLFANGRIVDLILVGVVLEALLLAVYRRRTGGGIATADILPNLLAGACLLLALRGALVGAGWVWIAACLLASLAAHGTDLRRRWRAARNRGERAHAG